MTPDTPNPQDDLDRRLDALLDFEAGAVGDDSDDGDGSLERVAAAAALALGAATPRMPLPAALRDRLEADADRHFAPAGPAPTVAIEARAPKVYRVAAWSGWIAAAASWLVLALALWPEPARDDRKPGPGPTTPPSAAAGWTAALRPSDHPLAQGAGGELVWDQATQQGRLRLLGLAGVEPRQGVYQLWIFDARRDPRYPVDGGTFTVADPSRPTEVPIRARLAVAEPTLFAITLEPPGGVVVSDRQRIMLTAAYP